ncbi:MAG: hypothetical protein HY281_03200 [Nitrospirae bacterium]|nr:hypothetical protein [Nitrospirota bacterium]
MTGRTQLHGFLAVLGIGLMILAGCVTKGTVNLDVQAVPPIGGMAIKKVDGLTITVTAFEDARQEKSGLGVRHHLWGGETTFNVPGGKPGDVVAKVMTDYLTRKGWRVNGSPDVTFSGKVLDFSVNAESKLGSTEITVKTKVIVQALNKADGSLIRMTINGDGRQRVFWFEPEDAQELAGEVLSNSLEKFVLNTKLEKNLLRLK